MRTNEDWDGMCDCDSMCCRHTLVGKCKCNHNVYAHGIDIKGNIVYTHSNMAIWCQKKGCDCKMPEPLTKIMVIKDG